LGVVQAQPVGGSVDLAAQAIEHSEEPDPTLYDHLGDVYAALKKQEKARESWEKAMSIEPNEIKEQLRKNSAPSPRRRTAVPRRAMTHQFRKHYTIEEARPPPAASVAR
jgi:tetratricopeptide (TPR) repeat protein